MNVHSLSIVTFGATTGSNRSALPQSKFCCSHGPVGRRRRSYLTGAKADGYNSY
jgi:hypothetical protein